MHHHRPIHVAICLALALLAVSSASRAEKRRPDAASADSSGDYGYVFSDDVMQAGAFTPDDPRIVVALHVQRVTLIRPRTAFVAELLKSVESL